MAKIKKCRRGHEMIEGNIYTSPEGYFECRKCRALCCIKWKINNPERYLSRFKKWRKNNRNKSNLIKRKFNEGWEEKKNRYRRWTEEEEKIAELWKGTIKELSKILDRSTTAIMIKRSKIKKLH